MHNPMGKQTIRCSVDSCRFHNTQQNCCELNDIHVSPVPGKSTATAADETLCASYDK